jgi:hypothetical protein
MYEVFRDKERGQAPKRRQTIMPTCKRRTVRYLRKSHFVFERKSRKLKRLNWLTVVERCSFYVLSVTALIFVFLSIWPLKYATGYAERVSCVCSATAPFNLPGVLPNSWCVKPDPSIRRYWSSVEEPLGQRYGDKHELCGIVYQYARRALQLALAWIILLGLLRIRAGPRVS